MMLGAISDNPCPPPGVTSERPPIITIVLQLLPNNHVKDSFGQQCQMAKKADLALQDKVQEMTSAWRVVSFFMVVFVVPTILIAVPLYARYQLYYSRTFLLSDGDVIALHETISSFWCQSQKITSNGTFSAFFTKEKRRNLEGRRTSEMATDIPLQHDEAEEWGFYLIKGSTVEFASCARWPGATLIVVQGEKNMRKCFYRETRTKEELMKPSEAKPTFAQESQPSSPRPPIFLQQDENNGGEELNQDDSTILKTFEPTLRNHSDANAESQLKGSNSPKKTERKDGIQRRIRRSSDLSKSFLSLEKNLNQDAKDKLASISFGLPQHGPTNANTFINARVSSILSSYNDTNEIFYGNSSFSSSEEFMSHCTSTIYSIDLSPYVHCPTKMDSKAFENDRWKFVANESDYYFFLFSSDNSIEANVINFRLKLNRVLYDTSDASLICSNATTECVFPLSFLGKGGVVVDFNVQQDEIKRLENLGAYQIISFCQPRSIVYTVLILLVPFVIVLFAFR